MCEEGCFAITFEGKYYKKADIFVKRSLRESEYRTGYRGLHIPKLGKERLKNEAESSKFIQNSQTFPIRDYMIILNITAPTILV